MADEMRQIALGGAMLLVHLSEDKPKKKTESVRSRKVAHGMAPGHESRSASRDKPEPRGIKQRTEASLGRRRESFVATSAGGHAQHMPGSQNRKKGATL